MGIAEAIPVIVAMLAFIVPDPRKEFVAILTERLTAIAMA